MLRTTLITYCLLTCGAVFADVAESEGEFSSKNATSAVSSGATELVDSKRSATKTLGAQREAARIQPTVHVNSTGVTSSYGTRPSSAAARLRSVRDSIFLPRKLKAPKQAPQESEDVRHTTTSRSSRRTASDPSEPAKVLDAASEADKPEPQTQADLPSVISRRGSQEDAAGSTAVAEATNEPTLADTIVQQSPVAASENHSLAPKADSALPLQAAVGTPPGKLRVESADAPTKVASLPSLQATPADQVTADPESDSPKAPEDSITEKSNTLAPQNSTGEPTNGLGSAIPAKMPPFSDEPAGVQLDEESSTPSQNDTSVDNAVRASTPAAASSQETGTPIDAKEDPILLANRSPILIVKTHGQSTIRVGRTASYFVTATNAGDLVAEDVVVSVNVPNWAELTRSHASSGTVRTEPNSNGDNAMRWSIRDLGPNSQQRLRIDLVPRSSRPIELGVSWNFKSVSAMAQIQVQEPKLQMNVSGPADIRFGDTKLYTITISNPGTGDAENVTLTLLPINDAAGPAAVKELGDIKAGMRRTIDVELTARQAGDLAVRATVTGDGGLRAEGRQDVRVRRANLVIDAVGPTENYAGTPASYSIKITNNGDATAHDVIAVVALPMAAEYISSSHSGSHDQERGRVKWAIGTLRPGAYQVLNVSAKLVGAGANRLDVRSASADKLVAAGSVVTEVKTLPDLRMTVEDPVGVLGLDTETTYEIHIENRGTRAAHNVNVIGYFSEGIEPVSVQGWRASVEVGQVVLDSIPRVAPGQEIVIKVIARADRAGDHVFRAELHSTDPQTKLAVEEWTVFDAPKPRIGDPSIQQADQSSSTTEPRRR